MNRVIRARLSSLAVWTTLASVGVFAACSGGGGTSGLSTGGNFVVLRTEPETNAQLFLNDPIRIDFSNNVDLNTVDLTTFSFQVFDQLGNAVQENVSGTFRLGRSPGDTEVGRRLEFVPVFPTNSTFDNGGFRPGRTYFVQLIGGSRVNGTVIRDTGGKALLSPITFVFHTAEGSSPSQLFRDTTPGGPARVSLSVAPTDENGAVILNKFGLPPVEVRLKFDQPLNPSETNLPVSIDLDPVTRSVGSRGRIFLEYDDPVYGDNRWIPARVELEANELDSATVLMRPLGVLPNNAEIRVIVESDVADISGESNVSNAAYDRVFGTFQTSSSYEQQFDAVLEEFDDTRNLDLAAPFGEPLAEVGPGYVKAGFAFEGTSTNLEFEPQTANVVLDTDFTMVTPKVGTPYNVSGGVFNFKNVTIPLGVHVQGTGSNPMVWLVSGRFEVSGTLSVRGGDGARGTQIAAANIPKQGGFGACGGGTGGDGSPSSTLRSLAGGTGKGPLQLADGGGRGGNLASIAGCGRGSGGGGGSFASQGDPHYPAKVVPTGTFTTNPTNASPVFVQQVGIGGSGCQGDGGSNTRSLAGGGPGPVSFVDARADNDFWGSAVDNFRGLRITGELAVPMGGGGGGGGGDLSYNNSSSEEDPNFNNDSTGGGGGGGGGVLIVKALGDIVITDTGRITADGGSGGAGEVNGSSSKGGGGGGGAAGMVILMSATQIVLHSHGNNYSQNDYDFAISADGGVCTTGTFVAPIVLGKYPANGTPIATGGAYTFEKLYDSAPLGGFGGMGVVQLMAPPGDNSDNTNTTLDDNIRVFKLGVEQTGTSKQQILAWRGFPNAQGQFVDDSGNPTNIGENEGDIRPSPILMPTPFAATSRIRSIWIDTGASARRALLASDNLPRGIVEQGGAQAGPRYSFAGLDPATGYVDYTIVGQLARTVAPTIGSPEDVVTVGTETYRGVEVLRVELATAALGSVVDLYAQNDAELLDASGLVLGSYRVVQHGSRILRLDLDGDPVPTGVARMQLRARYFDLVTDGEPGLGATYAGSQSGARVPNTNVRIGFAFHQNPGDPTATRYPANDGEYVYNLDDAAVQEAIRQLGASFVQFDIVFDGQFKSVPADVPPALHPDQPRPELRFLRLPYRF